MWEWWWVYSTLLAILISLFVYWILNRKCSHPKKATLICGQENSGKTSLFLRLVSNKKPITVPSATVNCSTGVINGKNLIFDIPGSIKLRDSLFQQHVDEAGSIILMLDSSNLEKFHQIVPFCIKVFVEANKRKLPILIIVGKEDLVGTTALLGVTSRLDSEMRLFVRRKLGNMDEMVDSDLGSSNENHYQNLLRMMGEDDDDPNNLSLNSLSTCMNLQIVTYSIDDPKSMAIIQHWITEH